MTRKHRKRPPRWIGASAPVHGVPTRPHTMRFTDAFWDRVLAAADADGKSASRWVLETIAERLGPATTDTNS